MSRFTGRLYHWARSGGEAVAEPERLRKGGGGLLGVLAASAEAEVDGCAA